MKKNELPIFTVDLKEGINGYDVKSDLEKLASDISIIVHDYKNLKMQLVNGTTSKETYEKVFKGEIEYQTKIINNINTGKREVQEWVELKPAQVPENLQDKVKRIYLSPTHWLTD
ncbi:hypothetical protein HY837_04875 [archaeon]|nr:hypothetical protein [archaeon]